MEDPMAAYGEALMRLDQSGALQSVGDAVSASVETEPVFGSVAQDVVYDGDTFVSGGGVEDVYLSLRHEETDVFPSYGARILLDEDDPVDLDYDGSLSVSDLDEIPGVLDTWSGVTVDLNTVDPEGDILLGTTWASWDPDATSDESRAYVVGGHWLDVREQEDGTYWVHSLGAFVDAPEDFSDDRSFAWNRTSGQDATYEGEAYGIYAGHQMAERTDDGIAVWHIGDFVGDLELNATFYGDDQGDVGGIRGTIDNIKVDYAALPEGSDEAIYGELVAAYTIHLDTAVIGRDDAEFVGKNVRMEHTTHDMESSSGTWGGEFSRIHLGDWDYSDDPPRLVAGTFGGTGLTSDSSMSEISEVTFVGSFAAGYEFDDEPPPDL